MMTGNAHDPAGNVAEASKWYGRAEGIMMGACD